MNPPPTIDPTLVDALVRSPAWTTKPAALFSPAVLARAMAGEGPADADAGEPAEPAPMISAETRAMHLPASHTLVRATAAAIVANAAAFTAAYPGKVHAWTQAKPAQLTSDRPRVNEHVKRGVQVQATLRRVDAERARLAKEFKTAAPAEDEEGARRKSRRRSSKGRRRSKRGVQ
ncbi:hypothetical protein H9P43_007241 [Blastocladiella emersonii ATCC 22665]|nr:hypothetical protein H9P43_007241 [Blastocladiella emersonii ATCC 22665]